MRNSPVLIGILTTVCGAIQRNRDTKKQRGEELMNHLIGDHDSEMGRK
jgi:6,7-dimethyl-8-ribityllumazine synthase